MRIATALLALVACSGFAPSGRADPLAARALIAPSSAPVRGFQREFACASEAQVFVVPPAVTTLYVEVHGGRGQQPHPSRGASAGGTGGHGARVEGTIAVVPGQVLTVWAGCGGGVHEGFGSSGPGGESAHPRLGKRGGAGGSASAVFDGADALVVAGGGGGGGGAGDGAAMAGGAGGNAGAVALDGQPGGGGGAGTGGCAGCGAASAGAPGDDATRHARSRGGGGGGGGGGHDPVRGIHGGGGGAGSRAVGGGGGGGAGASFASARMKDVTMATSTRPGDGAVVLHWATGALAAVPTFESTWTFPCSGVQETWTVPKGVTGIVLDVRGGRGADAEDGNGGFGGAGGRVIATMAVTENQVLTLDTGCGAQGKSGAYGYVPGGDGGEGGNRGFSPAPNGGGGGGASAVFLDGALVVLAGGGGGGGGTSQPVTFPGVGNGGFGGSSVIAGSAGADGLCPGLANDMFMCPRAYGGAAGVATGVAGSGGNGDSAVELNSEYNYGGGGGGGGGASAGAGGEAGNSGVVTYSGSNCPPACGNNWSAVGAGGGGGASWTTLPHVVVPSPSGPDGVITISAADYARVGPGYPDVFVATCDGSDVYTIPAEARLLILEAVGGAGVSPPGAGQNAASGLGGYGGIAYATFPVTPGAAMALAVGCLGRPGNAIGASGAAGGGPGSAASAGGLGGGGSGIADAGAYGGPFHAIAGGGGGGGGAAKDPDAFPPNTGGNGGNGGVPGTTGGSSGCCSGGGGGRDQGNAPLSTGSRGSDGDQDTFVTSGGGGGGGGGAFGGSGGHGASGQGGGGGGAGGTSDVDATAYSSGFATASNRTDGYMIMKFLRGQPSVITSAAPPQGVVGQGYSFEVQATGIPLPRFAVSSGALPPGLSIDGGSGVIGGVPTTVGAYSFSIAASNDFAAPAIAAYTMNVFRAPSITSGTPTFVAPVGVPYTFQVTAAGVPPPTFELLGTLPQGLALNTQTGLISGTPVAPGGYESAFNIVANNGINPPATSPQYWIAVDAPATITSGPPPASAQVGVPYSFLVTVVPAWSYRTLASGQLPPGLTLTVGGVLSGTPTAAGSYRFAIVANSEIPPGAVSPTYQIDVAGGVAPTITSGPPIALAAVGNPYSFQVTASGPPAPTFRVYSGALPPGLALDAASGVISGFTTLRGSYTFQIAASNGVAPDAVSPQYAIEVY